MSEVEETWTPQLVWHVYRVPIFLGFLSVLFIIISITIYIKSYQSMEPIRFHSDVQSATGGGEQRTVQNEVVVDIEGAVKKPGVYRLSRDSRVEDLLIVAGGFTHDVDVSYVGQSINRAAKLSDGAKIYIPYVGSRDGMGGAGAPEVKSGVLEKTMNINSASQSELESLSGVGPVTAEKIIGNRPYMRLEELIEKKVMSTSVFEAIRNQLSL